MSVEVLKFGAEWCPPCITLNSILGKLIKEFPDVVFIGIDIDEQPELAEKYNITSVPTLIFLKDGERKGSMVGLYNLEKIKERILEIIE